MTPVTASKHMLLADDLHRARVALLTQAHALGLAVGEPGRFARLARLGYVVVDGHVRIWSEVQQLVEDRTQG